jgi:hypothetical protein
MTYRGDQTDTGDTKLTEFHESLAATIPNRTYRSRIEAPVRPTVLQVLVRSAAVIVVGLLVIRFAIELFTTSRANRAVNSVFRASDWAVWPFQHVFGRVPAQSITMGTFDWSALAAIIGVIIISAILLTLLRRGDSY